jgi:hypothetical protein
MAYGNYALKLRFVVFFEKFVLSDACFQAILFPLSVTSVMQINILGCFGANIRDHLKVSCPK